MDCFSFTSLACFRTYPNGTLTNNFTEEVIRYDLDFLNVKSCFDNWLNINATQQNQTVCEMCREKYDIMNRRYFEISELYGENVCIDVVDTVSLKFKKKSFNEFHRLNVG